MSSTIQANNKKRNNKNDNLHKAKSAKNDEFYTQLTDVSKELMHYKKHFKNKIVFCNCDDPTWSAFWKYFHLNFEELGLKKLISTHYDKEEATYKMEYEGGNDNDIEVGIKTPLKGNGDFRDEECLDLLDECDIVVTNPPFSLFRVYIAVLMEHQKKFLVIGNKNAITYKEFFPLLKDNKIWIGYTNVKEFLQPDGSIKKFGNIGWFTNLDVAKRHEKLVLWKNYTPKEYPKYDNYDAINVNKVSEMPCDYCESWGLYQEEFDTLDKTQWEEVRREPINDTELIYVIPAKDTELRHALHEHTDGYKEEIEQVLAKSIYCNGYVGVPITVLDKYNPEQLEIVKFRKGDDEKDLTYTEGMSPLEASKQASKQADYTVLQNYCQKDIVTESSECQLHSLTSIVQSRLGSSDLNLQQDIMRQSLESHYLCWEMQDQESMKKQHMQGFLFQRHCNGIIGVPITFLDKYNLEQFEIVGLAPERLSSNESKLQIKRYVNAIQHKKDGTTCGGNKVNDGPVIVHNNVPSKFPYYTSETIFGKYLEVLYARVLIRKKVGD